MKLSAWPVLQLQAEGVGTYGQRAARPVGGKPTVPGTYQLALP